MFISYVLILCGLDELLKGTWLLMGDIYDCHVNSYL